MTDVIVIGAGAAGMLCAGTAALQGADTLLLERNEKVGRKIGITGKGRCNVTNNCDENAYIAHLIDSPRFMYSAVYQFPPASLMKLIEDNGTPLKTERGGRVFPVSDKSFDIIDALRRYVKKSGARISTGKLVKNVTREENGKFTVKTASDTYESRALVLSCGGMSYPTTGSSGDGYRFAKSFGLSVTPLSPGLIPLTCEETWCASLMGLSLRNVKASLLSGSHVIFEELGEMLFTHFGVSGPIILSGSSYLNAFLRKVRKSCREAHVTLRIDLKPGLTPEQLDARLLRDFDKYHMKAFEHALTDLMPRSLIPVLVRLSGIDPKKRARDISREERYKFGMLMKNLTLTVTGTRPLEEAIVTQGGVETQQLIPATMMAKSVPGLFICGEMLDVDGLTGGYNLQTAFSSGYAAGKGAAEYCLTQKTGESVC